MRAVYYREAEGSERVLDFLAALKPVDARVVVENQIDRLNLCEAVCHPCRFRIRLRSRAICGSSDAISAASSTESSTGGPITSLSFCTPSPRTLGRTRPGKTRFLARVGLTSNTA